MAQQQLAVRVDSKVKSAIDRYCDSRGLKLNRFVEDALIDKLEEYEDVEDLKSVRHEKTRPLAALLKDLGLDGKL
jgi:antitoxin component of RelBE/YafQ-DinJ toxin-antitoxin module